MKKLWISFAIVFCSFFRRSRMDRNANLPGDAADPGNEWLPPTARSSSPDGDIGRGQNVWQSLGGMEVGSIWGHGSYVAPDWTADWLHREATFVLDEWASRRNSASRTSNCSAEDKAKLRGRLEEIYRRNTYDAATGIIRIDPVRARAFEGCLQHFLRRLHRTAHEAYAIPAGQRRAPRNACGSSPAFMFWTCVGRLDRIGRTTSSPTPTTGRMSRWSAIGPPAKASCGPASASSCCWPASAPWSGGTRRKSSEETADTLPARDPLGQWVATPSQRATSNISGWSRC